jgi:hypothetical protein
MRDREIQILIHPSSCLSRIYPTALVFTELIHTNKLYARLISVNDKKKLQEQLNRIGILAMPSSFRRNSTQSNTNTASYSNGR